MCIHLSIPLWNLPRIFSDAILIEALVLRFCARAFCMALSPAVSVGQGVSVLVCTCTELVTVLCLHLDGEEAGVPRPLGIEVRPVRAFWGDLWERELSVLRGNCPLAVLVPRSS